MTINLYDATVETFLQITEGVAGTLAQGRNYCEENGLDINALSEARLCEDMLPLSFQINSVVHHSVNAINGVKAGAFAPPTPLEKTDYQSLQEHIDRAITALKGFFQDEVNALVDVDVTFSLGERKMPFTGKDFLLSFSLPNFYFHATTTYDLLRMKGVPLGKKDFIHRLKLKQG